MTILGAGLLLFSGCKEKPATEVVSEVSSYNLIQDRILTPTCATAGCHASEQDGDFKQHGLVLAKGKSYANLINILSRQPEAKEKV